MLHPQRQLYSSLPRKEVPDGLLVGQALAGDQDAFEVLVHRYQQQLVGLIQGLLKDHDQSDVDSNAPERNGARWSGPVMLREKRGEKSDPWERLLVQECAPFESTVPRTACSRLEKPPKARFTVLKSSQCTVT